MLDVKNQNVNQNTHSQVHQALHNPNLHNLSLHNPGLRNRQFRRIRNWLRPIEEEPKGREPNI